MLQEVAQRIFDGHVAEVDQLGELLEHFLVELLLGAEILTHYVLRDARGILYEGRDVLRAGGRGYECYKKCYLLFINLYD